MRRSEGDERAAAVARALTPYAWRDLTDRMLARMAVGAADRDSVLRFLAAVPGSQVGRPPPVEPADPGDERVHALVGVLEGQQWRGWSLGRLGAELVEALTSWQAHRESLASDLRRWLGDH